MADMTNSRLYKISAWKDNSVKIVLTQGEGTNAANPNYNKKLKFQLYDSDGLLTIPASGVNCFLAIERPDGTNDIIEGERLNNSDVGFSVKNTLTTVSGIVKGEIRLVSADSIVKFYGINFNVYGGTNNSNIENTEEFEALTRALQKVVNLTGDGTIADLDTVIAHSGTNPAASGVIYDYLVANFYTKTESDNKYQTLANKTQTIDSDRQTTTQNAAQYPSVAAVKDFLYANFLTENEIDNLLDNIYSKTESDDKFALKNDTYTKSETYTKTESDDKFALKNNTYTKSEIAAIQTENNKRFALAMTVAFDSNGVPVKFSSNTSFSAGAFSNAAITTVFIGNNVQLIQSGAFVTCTNLTDVYVDKLQSSITIQDQAFPAGATIHYMDGFNVGELIIAAIKYLNTIKANAADVYTKAQTDNIIEGVTQQIEGVTQHVINYTLTANGWSNGEQEITINAGDYDVSAYTKVDIEPGANVLESLVNDGVFALYIENDDGDLTAKVIGDNVPRQDIIVQLVLTEVNVIESVPE